MTIDEEAVSEKFIVVDSKSTRVHPVPVCHRLDKFEGKDHKQMFIISSILNKEGVIKDGPMQFYLHGSFLKAFIFRILLVTHALMFSHWFMRIPRNKRPRARMILSEIVTMLFLLGGHKTIQCRLPKLRKYGDLLKLGKALKIRSNWSGLESPFMRQVSLLSYALFRGNTRPRFLDGFITLFKKKSSKSYQNIHNRIRGEYQKCGMLKSKSKGECTLYHAKIMS
jgi:hypothetical protein